MTSQLYENIFEYIGTENEVVTVETKTNSNRHGNSVQNLGILWKIFMGGRKHSRKSCNLCVSPSKGWS